MGKNKHGESGHYGLWILFYEALSDHFWSACVIEMLTAASKKNMTTIFIIFREWVSYKTGLKGFTGGANGTWLEYLRSCVDIETTSSIRSPA